MSVSTVVSWGLYRATEHMVNIGPVARANEYGWNYTVPNAVPPLASAVSGWVSGILQEGSAKAVARFHGVRLPDKSFLIKGEKYNDGVLEFKTHNPSIALDPWVAYVWQQQFTPGLDILKSMYFRGNIDNDALAHYLRANSIPSQGMGNAIIQQWVDIPDAVQMVGLGAVGALNAGRLTTDDLLAEMPVEYQIWAQAAGASNVTIRSPGGIGTPITLNMLDVFWAGHWRYPRFEVALDWAKRLRLDAFGDGIPRDPSGIVIDADELTQLAQIEGISPQWRDAYEAISYKVGSIRFLRILAQYGNADAKALAEALLDLGYRPDVAVQLAEAIAKQARITSIKAAHSAAHGWIVQAWEAGVVSTQIMQSYWASEELTQDQIDIATNDVVIQRQLKRVLAITNTTRKGYMRGSLNEQQARGVLEQAGIDVSRINELIDDWKIERLGSIPMQSVSKLVSYAKQSIISPAYLLTRLQNVDMDNDDIKIIMADVTIAIQNANNKRLLALEKQIQKQLLAAERAAEKAAREAAAALRQEEAAIEKAIKAAQTLLKQQQTQLTRQSSPSMMKKQLCAGLITPQQVADRLSFLGWSKENAASFLAEATNPCKPTGGSVDQGVINEVEADWPTQQAEGPPAGTLP